MCEGVPLQGILPDGQDVVGGVDAWSQKHTQKEDSVSNTGEGREDRPAEARPAGGAGPADTEFDLLASRLKTNAFLFFKQKKGKE